MSTYKYDVVIVRAGLGGSMAANESADCGLKTVLTNLWKKKEDHVYIVDVYQSKCFECAAYYQACESGAIDFHYPPSGTGVIFEKG
jgi:ferredoxin-like protein FixX